MNKEFILTANHPSGTVFKSAHPTLRDAQRALSYAIYDNGYADKKTAQTLCMIKPGEGVTIKGALFSLDVKF